MEEIRVGHRGVGGLNSILADRRSALLTAGLLIVLTAAGGFFDLRSSPAKVAPPATYGTSPSPDDAVSAATVGEIVMVHVAGAVKDPGLYPLPVGSRFADAVMAAGGPTPKADLHLLNLAQIALDGTKVEVPRRTTRSQVGNTVATPAPSAGATPAPISLNSADQVALEIIPGIGPVTAAAILQHRDEIGGFTSLEQLLDVSGIGPATYESMRDFVSL